jgi:hypothetical protein
MIAFGGGGDEGDFGLCVEDDFRRGSTGRCETFGNEPLCSQDQFGVLWLPGRLCVELVHRNVLLLLPYPS